MEVVVVSPYLSSSFALSLACVQAASDVYSPISGEVLEVNSVLVDEPAKVSGIIESGTE